MREELIKVTSTNIVGEAWGGEVRVNGLLCHFDAPDKERIPYTQYELSEMVAVLRKHLDFTIDVFHEIIAGKPGVNLSNDYLRGWDIGLAEEALSVLEGITAIAENGHKSETA